MQIFWTSEGGHLVARDQSGELLQAWAADLNALQQLPDLLNHFQDLSQAILGAFLMPPSARSAPQKPLKTAFLFCKAN